MKRSSSVTLTKPRSLTLESGDKGRHPDNMGVGEGPMMRARRGRQPLMIGPDTKVFVVWLENFEDHENFPAGELALIKYLTCLIKTWNLTNQLALICNAFSV